MRYANHFVCLLTLAVSVILAPSTAFATPTITNYTPGFPNGSRPQAIVVGPHGYLWVTEDAGGGGIAVLSPTGSLLDQMTSVFLNPPEYVAAGPDDSIWFTERGAVGELTSSGGFNQFTSGLTPGDTLMGITEGPDGNIWFTQDGASSQIGRISPTGAITDFGTGLTADSDPWEITAGPNGNLWFTESGNPGAIGEITTTGVITQFSTGLTPNDRPTGITTGPDGNVWFTESGSTPIVGRITPAGKITQFPVSGPYAALGDITAGDDGNLYFTETGVGPSEAIGEITTSGVISQYAMGLTANAQPSGIGPGPDGNVWFAEAGTSGAGSITLAPGVASTSAPSVAEQAASLSGAVTPNAQDTTYSFQYGTTTLYGSVTSVASAGSGDSAVVVSAPVAGLAPGTLYHYRLVATNTTGTTYGPDQTFTTITPLPAPALGRSVDASVVSGTVMVRSPGSSRFHALTDAQIPTGSIVNAGNGVISLTTTLPSGATQSATLWGGVFKVTQSRTGPGTTNFVMDNRNLASCRSNQPDVHAARVTRKRPTSDTLWATDNNGKFSTLGNNSVATVRGTYWLTVDNCAGTLTRVIAGVVAVRNLHAHRTVMVAAGQSYLARTPMRKRGSRRPR